MIVTREWTETELDEILKLRERKVEEEYIAWMYGVHIEDLPPQVSQKLVLPTEIEAVGADINPT